MRKVLFLLVFYLCFSCNNEKHEKIRGLYFEEKTSSLYELKKNKIIVYDILDSISYERNFSPNKILKDYEFSIPVKDSLIIYNFSDSNENIYLKKVNYFDDKLLVNNSGWFIKELEEITQYLHFNSKGDLYSIFEPKNKDINNESFKVEYRGKYFNQFHVYVYGSILIPTYINKDKISFYIIDYLNNNKTKEVFFNKIKNADINKKVIGRWKASDDYEIINFDTFDYYKSKINNNHLGYQENKDSIINFLEYRSIEFTDRKFKRYLINSKKVIENNIKRNPSSNRIFIENDKVEFQYFDIISVSEDSLKIHLSMPDLKINYHKIKE